MLNESLNEYLIELDGVTLKVLDNYLQTIGFKKAFMQDLHAMDCTRVMRNGQRIIQTIDFPYYMYISRLDYLLEHRPEGEPIEGYINMIMFQHETNLEYEKNNPPVIYDKKKGLKKIKTIKSSKLKEKGKTAKEQKLANKVAKLNKLKFNISITKNE